MKKILILTSFPPTKKTAGQNFSRQLIVNLSKKAEIDLVYFSYEDHEIETISNINFIKKIKNNFLSKIVNVLLCPFVHPFFSSRFNLVVLFWLLRNKNYYDIILFDFTQIHLYSYFIKHPKKIHFSHDVIIQKFSRVKKKFECLFIRYSEKLVLKRAGKIFTFSYKDTRILEDFYKIKSEPVNFFLDREILTLESKNFEFKDHFSMYGAWNRKENYEGLDWYLDNVHSLTQNLKIIVIGPKMPSWILEKINTHSNISYLGFVENPYIHIAESRALIAPVFTGAGVKVKVIESLALGLDIIGTKVAFEGIKNNGSLLECNTSIEFVNCLNKYNNKKINRDVRIEKKDKFLESYKENNLVKKILNY